MGPRRLLLPALPVGICSIMRYAYFLFPLGLSVPVDVDWLCSGHKYLHPKAIHDNEVVDELANDYMHFARIKFINSVCLCPYVSVTIVALTGFSDKNSFSPVALAYARRHFSCTWFLRTPYAQPSTAAILFPKVENMGQGQPAMIKRYKAQVPGRLFVMQHFLFGSILPCKGPPPPSETVHAGDEGRGDCCGYPSERFCSCEGKGGREEDRRAWDMTGPI
ncbi:hypothetical protein PISMIDRAFT_618793 [Pisolithus microcarpus 441]|uniref:peptidylprolyl isomerase n=1 Tax=Pisolithus microcarpus 441 TaxID=765257 RepID=A0A0C9ZID3_9AGAM|nr:hypothetical protein PISMIDRAFT_618793 [Pisolithus microcarpus 441]